VSGAPLKGEKASTIFEDVTIVFPLVVAAAREKIEG
jgi:deoxyhypusine synthase